MLHTVHFVHYLLLKGCAHKPTTFRELFEWMPEGHFQTICGMNQALDQPCRRKLVEKTYDRDEKGRRRCLVTTTFEGNLAILNFESRHMEILQPTFCVEPE